MKRLPLLTLLLCTTVAHPLTAAAKSLDWKKFEVQAHLENDGDVTIKEEQTIVFDGDWNGGERRFDVAEGRSVDLISIQHWSPSVNGWIPVERGELSKVDRYQWTSSDTIRWRSRLPLDPPFHNTEERYLLQFRIHGAGQAGDPGQTIVRFPVLPGDRPGSVQVFDFHFTADPSLGQTTSDANEQAQMHRENVPAGTAIFARMTLTGGTSSVPIKSTSSSSPSGTTRFALVAGLVLIIGILLWKFFDREKSLGRFSQGPSIQDINENFLNENLFRYPPEIVNVLWEEEVGTKAVLTLLSRLQCEGKIRLSLDPREEKGLIIQRIAPIEEFQGYAGILIQHLIPTGDTFRFQEWLDYWTAQKEQPDIPSRVISDQLLAQMDRDPEISIDETDGKILPWGAIGFSILAINFFIFGLLHDGAGGFIFIFSVIYLGALCAKILGRSNKEFSKKFHSVSDLAQRLIIQILIPGAVFLYFLIFTAAGYSLPSQLSLVFAFASVVSLLFHFTRSQGEPKRVLKRRNLRAIREWLAQRLRSKTQPLDAKYLPYCVALELNKDLDRASIIDRLPSSSSGDVWVGGDESTDNSVFVGHGGMSGGAGASVSWDSALSSLNSITVQLDVDSGGGGGGGSGGGAGGW
jgi:uncharacterized membrane protein YgcG